MRASRNELRVQVFSGLPFAEDRKMCCLHACHPEPWLLSPPTRPGILQARCSLRVVGNAGLQMPFTGPARARKPGGERCEL
jgi:hypothetical protein